VDIRLSRHAKNKIRLYKINISEIENVIQNGERCVKENKFESSKDNIKVIWITVGSYRFVITVFRRG
jgi:hypothetical protein